MVVAYALSHAEVLDLFADRHHVEVVGTLSLR
jgi:hypothetical protein